MIWNFFPVTRNSSSIHFFSVFFLYRHRITTEKKTEKLFKFLHSWLYHAKKKEWHKKMKVDIFSHKIKSKLRWETMNKKKHKSFVFLSIKTTKKQCALLFIVFNMKNHPQKTHKTWSQKSNKILLQLISQ
jgi:hypothetical protein